MKNIDNKNFTLSNTDWSYLAGFIDGDGSIITQIVKRDDYAFKYMIRLSIVFYQKTSRHWFLIKLQKLLHNKGFLRKRNDGMSELSFVQKDLILEILNHILPYSKVKTDIIKKVILIIHELDHVKNRCDFLKVCKIVDETANLTDSKKRKITSKTVEDSWKFYE